jgi:hypothetical protein
LGGYTSTSFAVKSVSRADEDAQNFTRISPVLQRLPVKDQFEKPIHHFGPKGEWEEASSRHDHHLSDPTHPEGEFRYPKKYFRL